MGNFLCVLWVAFTSAKFLANSQMTDMFTSGLQSQTTKKDNFISSEISSSEYDNNYYNIIIINNLILLE